jgi:hypothetical protein
MDEDASVPGGTIAWPRSMTLSAIQAEYGRVVHAAEAKAVFAKTPKRQTRRLGKTRIVMRNEFAVYGAKSNCFVSSFLGQDLCQTHSTRSIVAVYSLISEIPPRLLDSTNHIWPHQGDLISFVATR